MKKLKGPLDREDDFNGGPSSTGATSSIRFVDTIRDVQASAQKICIERDKLLKRVEEAERLVEKYITKLMDANEEARGLDESIIEADRLAGKWKRREGLFRLEQGQLLGTIYKLSRVIQTLRGAELNQTDQNNVARAIRWHEGK